MHPDNTSWYSWHYYCEKHVALPSLSCLVVNNESQVPSCIRRINEHCVCNSQLVRIRFHILRFQKNGNADKLSQMWSWSYHAGVLLFTHYSIAVFFSFWVNLLPQFSLSVLPPVIKFFSVPGFFLSLKIMTHNYLVILWQWKRAFVHKA